MTPMLQRSLELGAHLVVYFITKYLNGEVATYANASHAYVHVGDAAEAHVRVLEVPAAGARRYVCAESSLHRGELCRALAELFPEYPIPTRWSLYNQIVMLYSWSLRIILNDEEGLLNAYSSCFFSRIRCKDEVGPPKKGYKFTNQPLKDLGMKFTPLREYLYEAVKSLQEKGFLPKAYVKKVKMYSIMNLRSLSIQSGIRVCISYIQLLRLLFLN